MSRSAAMIVAHVPKLACVFLFLVLVDQAVAQHKVNPISYDSSSNAANNYEHAAPTSLAASSPAFCAAMHDVGRVSLLVTSGGMFGSQLFNARSAQMYPTDSSGCYQGSVVPFSNIWPGEYPLGSGNKFLLQGGLWVGGVTAAGDTLVSTTVDMSEGNIEFYADASPRGNVLHRSLLDPQTAFDARSDQDYIAVYTDTFVRGVPGLDLDWTSKRPHRPLGIRVTQISSEWSNPLVNNFVIVEFDLENIGANDLRDVFVGLFSAPTTVHERPDGRGGTGDIAGYLRTFPAATGCDFTDTLNVAWWADNDGNPNPSTHQWEKSGVDQSVKDIMGVRILQAPFGAVQQNFNWWTDLWGYFPAWDYGPRHRPINGGSLRDFGTGGTGTPVGDANKYYQMSNGEVDPDQPRVRLIQSYDPEWEFPPSVARSVIYKGQLSVLGTLNSVGPFDLRRGIKVSFVVAFIGGRDFHIDPSNGDRLFAGDVDGWYAHVDFSDLAKNAKMADWVFDNPGVDTDGDGYAGKSRVCVLDSALVNGRWTPTAAETTFYTGDGVPDWRAVGPPPAPKFWLTPSYRGITVRFNGKNSETTKDLVTNRIDFEGYRIYCGLDDRESSLSMVASYDRPDYDKYLLNRNVYPDGAWQIKDYPFTLERLKCLYGSGADPCHDPLFDPLRYTQSYPYRAAKWPDSLFYFVPHDYNASEFGKTTQIKKRFPEAKLPAPDSVTPDDLTPDGYLKYYEYEFTIPNLLPTMQYFVNVTAFDFGDPSKGVDPLESSKMLGIQTGYPLADLNQLGSELPPAYVYPNPYYGDGRYRANGYEGRTSDASDDRVRKIHFVNVPAKCTVRVLTLDGDIVTEIHHDKDPNDANAHHETWDMISRNRETVVSGLYYWAVEGADGKVQIGKFVIIR